MKSQQSADDIFVRVDPGEPLVATLRQVAIDYALSAAAITSGVGMIDGIELGFFDVKIDDYVRNHLDGIFDLSVVLGNITRKDGNPVPHVHMVFNDPEYRTFSGHVIEAYCHITIEVFLSTNKLSLRRVKLAGCPATRILIADQ